MNSVQDNSNDKRVNNILEVVMAYARLDFTQKTIVHNNNDMLDAIGTGINMLGEELENSTLSLKEKEQMIKEIHHRVKNNLQIVSSLLNLQSENTNDEEFKKLIVTSRNRINSIALVHEMLYTTGHHEKVEVNGYIQMLGQNIHNSLTKPNSNIKFEYNIEKDFYLDLDTMIPIGLILNEIFTNSIKYAFPDNTGVISVTLNKKNNLNNLLIQDNGLGLPENYKNESKTNLGLKLIEMLTEQIDGKLEILNGKGTGFKIVFK